MDAEAKRRTMKSPLLSEQQRLPELQELYRKHNVELKDWSSSQKVTLHGAPFVEAPDSDFNELQTSFRELNLGVSWVKNAGEDQQRQHREVAVPMLEPEFLVRYWNLMAELRSKNPFDVRFEFPEEIGMLHAAAPHFSLRSTSMIADVSGKYPQNSDRLPISFAEIEQSIKFTNAAVAMNNVIHVASRVLTWRVEDVSTELAQDRVTERILCAVIREASKLLNDLLLKQNIISTCVMRRDSMLRTNVNPIAHPITFSTPVPSTGPFILDFNTDELLQWIDDWGKRTMRQQKEDTRRWELVKAKRDAVFAHRKEEEQERRFHQFERDPTNPPSAAQSPARFDSEQLEESDVISARQRHSSV